MMIVKVPQLTRSGTTQISQWLRRQYIFWSFIKDEWQEAVDSSGWVFAFGVCASKLRFWEENPSALEYLLKKRARQKN